MSKNWGFDCSSANRTIVCVCVCVYVCMCRCVYVCVYVCVSSVSLSYPTSRHVWVDSRGFLCRLAVVGIKWSCRLLGSFDGSKRWWHGTGVWCFSPETERETETETRDQRPETRDQRPAGYHFAKSQDFCQPSTRCPHIRFLSPVQRKRHCQYDTFDTSWWYRRHAAAVKPQLR